MAGELMDTAIAGLRGTLRTSIANNPWTAKGLKCVQAIKITPLLRDDDGAHARLARITRHHSQGVRCLFKTT